MSPAGLDQHQDPPGDHGHLARQHQSLNKSHNYLAGMTNSSLEMTFHLESS